MKEVHKLVLERIHNALPHPQIEAAFGTGLEDMQKAGISTERCPDALVGSQLLNISTAAMDVLRKEPGIELINREIQAFKSADDLGSYTMRILNASIGIVDIHRRTPAISSPYIKKVGSCALAEKKFMDAIDDEPFDDYRSVVYCNSSGDPLLFEKEAGEPSAIIFKKIVLNGIPYPAGTIFPIKRNETLPKVRVGKFYTMPFNNESILGIGPLRFSKFTFKPEDRENVFQTVIAGTESIDSVGLLLDEPRNSLNNRFLKELKESES